MEAIMVRYHTEKNAAEAQQAQKQENEQTLRDRIKAMPDRAKQ